MVSGLEDLDKGDLRYESEHISSNKIHYHGKYLRPILLLSCVLKRWSVRLCRDALTLLWFGYELKLGEMAL